MKAFRADIAPLVVERSATSDRERAIPSPADGSGVPGLLLDPAVLVDHDADALRALRGVDVGARAVKEFWRS